MIYLNLLCYLMLLIPVLVNVAFITLLERKILGLRQLRKGPHKVSLIGILQPFRDAIKLFSKEIFIPYTTNTKQFIVSPVLSLLIVLRVYMSFPLIENRFCLRMGIIFVYMVISINVYPLIIRGWSSNRKYALIGRMRGIAQTVSYEVMFALALLFFLFLSFSLNLVLISKINSLWLKALVFIPVAAIIFISSVAETNRTPFDFAEGESELVSGFNVEYGRVIFAIIFMAEYARILFIRILFSVLFVGGTNSLMFYLRTSRLVFLWVWFRATYPRHRYDKLINLAWKVYLPVCLAVFLFVGLIYKNKISPIKRNTAKQTGR